MKPRHAPSPRRRPACTTGTSMPGANEQTALLRAGKLAEADLEHIAEEIESMGKTEKVRARQPAGRAAAAASAEMALSARPPRRLMAGGHPRAAPWTLTPTWPDNPSLRAVVPQAIAQAFGQRP